MKTNTEYYNILEYNKIKSLLTEFASTDYSKNKIENLVPFLKEIDLKHALKETENARKIIDYSGNAPIPDVQNAKNAIELIDKSGILFPDQLDNFLKFIATCRRLKTYLKKAEATDTSLAYSGVNINTLDEIYDEINRCITGNEVDTNASTELRNIRRLIDVTSTQIKTKLDVLMKSKKNYCAENFLSIKNGHYTIPVKKEYKNQISGSVITVSAKGTTFFIEPTIALKLTEKLEVLKTEEYIEKERILYTIAGIIDQYNTEIHLNVEIIENIDFAFAKGKLSSFMDATAPSVNTKQHIKIIKGRHPMLNKDECVPLDFEIGNEVRGIVVTGPNTGGKTVTLKLVGLFSIMAQSGLHLPCEYADMCMNSNILCDIGDGQNITQNLSTFSSHIINITDILNNTGVSSLILLDELGSGTDPAEGMGIATAILEELRQRKCLFVVTTHYAEVKNYAENAIGLVNARMTFDKDTLKPKYKLIIGEAGESCAFHIAKRLGFPEHLLKFAYEQTYQRKNIPLSDDTNFLAELNADKKAIPTITTPKIEKIAKPKVLSEHANSFKLGDSVLVMPDKKMELYVKQLTN